MTNISNGVKAPYLALIAVVMWVFSPHAAVASTMEPQQPFVFEIKSSENIQISLFDIADVLKGENLPKVIPAPEQTVEGVTQYIDPRIEILRSYLESKNSPMASYAEELLANYHYRLIIGISFAESNFCKRNIRPHNCWGIGGGKPEQYPDYPQAFNRADQLIQKYHSSGLVSAKLMRNRWVGWKNDKWILAVEQVTRELEKRGI